MTYTFESGLAHHIEGLIQQKRADGYVVGDGKGAGLQQS